MKIRSFSPILTLAALAALAARTALAGEPEILPGEIQLSRKGQEHRLLVEDVQDGQGTADLTGEAKFISSNRDVAIVSEDGVVTAVGDGRALIRGKAAGKPISAAVEVNGSEEPFDWNFRNHIQPILFKTGCNTGACHGAAAGKNGFKLSLRGFDFDLDHKALTREAKGRRVSLAEPEQSLMLLKPTMEIPHEGGERFTKDSVPYRRIVDWIRSGAQPASDEDPLIDRVEIFPSAMRLAPGGEQQIVVRAVYDDGSSEDVTPWVKYGTTDEAVATVDDDGKITVIGPGSTSITVWYSSKVAFVDLAVPRETPVAPEVFANAERANFVDDHVIAKLKGLNVAPAGPCSDSEFLRRAFLDTVGVLPAVEEVKEFLADSSPDKRSRLIDSLLERTEYVDYWSHKWSDLLLLSSKNLTRPGDLNAFYRFIRNSVEENKPWDQFSRDILTARGSTYENGAAAYFLMHREPTDLTETTSVAFLGTSITCARCHNHPLEKWTQDDYYGMANLLSRIKLKNGRVKNGASNGDTLVQPAAFGNIIHPRLGEPVPPRPLDGEAIPLDAAGDRREVLADWVTSPENPYFTRAIVNRVWRNYMGIGIVDPEDDLRLTNPPTNEPLFAALCEDLVEHEYDLKHLIRTIMNSATYQRSSKPADPDFVDGKYYSHYIVRRLKAEVILDTYSQVTGVPTPFSGYPEGARALQLRDSQVASYFLAAFGRPERRQTCACERTEDANIAQTLHIANGDTLNDKLRDENSIAARLTEGGATPEAILDAVFYAALSRPPSPRERANLLEAFLASNAEEASKEETRGAVEDLAWAVLSSKEFLFNH